MVAMIRMSIGCDQPHTTSQETLPMAQSFHLLTRPTFNPSNSQQTRRSCSSFRTEGGEEGEVDNTMISNKNNISINS